MPQIAHYELTRRLGAGGMGVVYEASDPSLQRKVAVEIPSDGELVVGSVNRGQPLMLSNPTSPVGKAISQIADIVIGSEDDEDEDGQGSKSLLGKMFGKK